MKTKLLLNCLQNRILSDLSHALVSFVLILALCPEPCALSQIPQGFNYQAIARDGSGNPITDASMPVRLTIQADSAGTIVIWQELFSSITTNSFGLFNLVMGRGVRQSGSAATFDAIDWSVTPKFIKTEVNYGGWKDMGTTRFWSVPYSLYSKTAANGFSGNYNDLSNKPTILNSQWTTSGANIYYNSGNVGIGTATPSALLQVAGDARLNHSIIGDAPELNYYSTGNRYSYIDFHGDDTYTDYSLRIIRYNTGPDASSSIVHRGLGEFNLSTSEAAPLKFYTSGSPRMIIASDGKVGIGTTTPASKVVIQPPAGWDDNTPLLDIKNKDGVSVFTVYNNGIRAFVQTNSGKGTKGGFAIGGFDPTKAGNVNLMSITPDSIRFYIDNASSKATKGGFAIGSFDNSKGANQDFMYLTPQASGNGQYNTFVGYKTGYSTSGTYPNASFNSYIGYNSGYSNTTGYGNVFLGWSAGYSNTTGATNVFLGANAGKNNTTGNNNTFVGTSAGMNLTSGSGNILIGWMCGAYQSNYITGDDNIAIGTNFYYNTTGNANIFIGTSSGIWNSTGTRNTMIGKSSGRMNSTGNNNTYAGYMAGDRNNGSNNVFLGYYAGYGSITDSYKLTIEGNGGNYMAPTTVLIYGDFQTRTLTFNASVGIGTTAPGQKLDITAGNGRVQTGYSWLTNSDIRYKKNITTLEHSLDKILNLRGVRFDLVADSNIIDGKGKYIGFIAQELEKQFPEFVVTEKNGYKSIAYDKLSAVLVEAIKEQQEQIESTKKENQYLRSELEELKSLVNNLAGNQTGQGNR